MLDKYKYTDKEQKDLLSSVGILIDTREKSSHVKEWLEQKKIPYKIQKLEQGDYSCYIPANPKLHIEREIYTLTRVLFLREKDHWRSCQLTLQKKEID
ncbi:hypothetical protein ACR77J_07305 [Tissierella praeacuta]|uniref:hypothetical protein n=1 Tax=Tissierella praeacuta TaxID=43131 RepID=UPI003DA5941B